LRVFVFDLLAYGQHLDHLKVGNELPYPLSREHCDPEVAIRTYEEHLEAWELLDKLGFDGVGFNEHHTSPYGLMNSPNIMAAAAAQRTKNLKLLIYGNLLPMHQPLRLAEELAMIDCLSKGRLISGFARGIPREYDVYNVAMSESRERFEEAFEIITRAWTQDSFSYEGKFWSYKDVSIWPRPVQNPHPAVSIPVTSSQESLDWAAARGIPITPGAATMGLREDVVRYFAAALARNGRKFTPDMMWIPSLTYLADSKAQAVKEYAPYHLYFNRTLYSHGNFTETSIQAQAGYVSDKSKEYVREENLKAYARSRDDFRKMTFEDVEKAAQNMPWGTADEVTQRLITAADHAGAGTILVSMNRGAMPHEMFMNQIRRFARDVLPALKAHEVTHAKCLEGVKAA
jgi:alkanesulfonate monooxygenase SsuD/methylene tetrahydromethanopterin reductase-like flavin-dependent oxidoreductase (luciferase family)